MVCTSTPTSAMISERFPNPGAERAVWRSLAYLFRGLIFSPVSGSVYSTMLFPCLRRWILSSLMYLFAIISLASFTLIVGTETMTCSIGQTFRLMVSLETAHLTYVARSGYSVMYLSVHFGKRWYRARKISVYVLFDANHASTALSTASVNSFGVDSLIDITKFWRMGLSFFSTMEETVISAGMLVATSGA